MCEQPGPERPLYGSSPPTAPISASAHTCAHITHTPPQAHTLTHVHMRVDWYICSYTHSPADTPVPGHSSTPCTSSAVETHGEEASVSSHLESAGSLEALPLRY